MLFSSWLCCSDDLYAPYSALYVFVPVPVVFLHSRWFEYTALRLFIFESRTDWHQASPMPQMIHLLHFHCCSNNERLILYPHRRLQIRDAIESMRLPWGASGCDHGFIDDVSKVIKFPLPLMTLCHWTVWNNACRMPVIPRFILLTRAATLSEYT